MSADIDFVMLGLRAAVTVDQTLRYGSSHVTLIPAGTQGTVVSASGNGKDGDHVRVWLDTPVVSISLRTGEYELTGERLSDLQREIMNAAAQPGGLTFPQLTGGDSAIPGTAVGRARHRAAWGLVRMRLLDQTRDFACAAEIVYTLPALGADLLCRSGDMV